MPCENLTWGFWRHGLYRGKKYKRLNPHPENKRAKLIIGGEWYYDEEEGLKCREWTKEEINNGYGIVKGKKVKLVPINCGHCDQCRLSRSNEWVTRIICESRTCENKGCKIDLTYNPEHVPDGFVLKKSDYQGFVKKLRIYLERHDPKYKGFKYYIGGEYGPIGGRPHYHIVIIGWEPTDLEFFKMSNTGYPMYTSKIIDENWTTGKGKNKTNNGYATIEPLTPETISYATRYTNKKSGNAKVNKGVPEFQAQSQNIGLKYWEQNKREIINDTGIWIKKEDKAKLVKIPRYFCKKWQEEYPMEYEMYVDWKTNRIEKQQKEKLSKTDKKLSDYLKDEVETSKYIYKLLKRNNLEYDEPANDKYYLTSKTG